MGVEVEMSPPRRMAMSNTGRMVAECIKAGIRAGAAALLQNMKIAPLVALLILLDGAATAKSPVGRYRLVGEHDVASQLEIRPDGGFSYMLAAGALDEQAEGRWTSDGKVVRLTTAPKPKPAEFSAGSASHTNEGPLRLKVNAPDGHGIAGVDLRVGFEKGEPIESYTQEYGWELPSKEKRVPRWVELGLAMYAIGWRRFEIDVAKANDLSFVFTPNDFGTVDFQDLPLDIEEGRLVMHRYGGLLNYSAVGD
jgi:hypothetical protein